MDQSSARLDSDETATPHLRRVLTLWDLVFYGIVLIQPIAPVPLFGVAQKLSDGHFVTTILIAMLAMTITAFSYGRMASLYPSAGSAYTYVARGINPYLGFLVGWAMLLDYLLIPIVNGIWVAVAIHSRYLTQIPYAVAMFLVVAFMVGPNLRGIRTSARADKILLVAMCSVTAAFILLAIRYLFHGQGWGGLLSTQPFYNPKTFNTHTVWTATSYAALTYIGFEGVTTLSEDAKNPKRNVMLATVLVCVFTGVFGGFLVYLGQRVWPDWQTLPNLETAFMDVCRRVGGFPLFHAMGFTILLAQLGGGLAGVVGAARLLYGMGRDNVLPRKIFGYLSPGTNTPTYNILLIGAIAFVASLGLERIGNAYEHAGELLNFGAFFAYLNVNLSAFWQFTFVQSRGRKPRIFTDILLPLFGCIFCGVIWWNLNIVAKVVGGIWFLIGIAYIAINTGGFRRRPVTLDFSES
jgi:amino acid transporter